MISGSAPSFPLSCSSEAPSSSSTGSLSYVALAKVAAMTITGPAAISGPATLPPTTWPCPLER